MEYPINWEVWIPLILGSSVLASFIAFGLEVGKSYVKETREHNKNIKLIFNELNIINTTFQNKDIIRDLNRYNRRILLPTGNIDYLTPKIAGFVKSKTLNELQQVHDDVVRIRNDPSLIRRLSVNEEINKINRLLEKLRGETKGWILKPKLD